MGVHARARETGGRRKQSVEGDRDENDRRTARRTRTGSDHDRARARAVPEAHLAWKPHPKSMSLGQLALHVATVPATVAALAVQDIVPARPVFVQDEALTTAELVPALQATVAQVKQLLGNFDDAKMSATWRLMQGSRELMAVPRAAFVRAIMLNHWYHHRGQLLVYLRMLDMPVPAVYGPSADENPFAAELAAAS